MLLPGHLGQSGRLTAAHSPEGWSRNRGHEAAVAAIVQGDHSGLGVWARSCRAALWLVNPLTAAAVERKRRTRSESKERRPRQGLVLSTVGRNSFPTSWIETGRTKDFYTVA